MRLTWANPNQRRSTFAVIVPLWLILFCSSVQQVIVAPVLPRISEELQLGPDSEPVLGLLGTAFSLSLMLVALVAGALSDKLGRRKIILIGSAALAITLILHAMAVSIGMLILLRGLSGAAAGLLTGSFAAYIGDYFPYEKRGMALGWVLSGFAAGWIIGIPAGTILAGSVGFTAPFVAFGWIMVVAWLLALLLLPQPDVPRDAAPLSVRRIAAKHFRLIRRRQPGTIVLCYFLMYACAGLFIFFLPTWLEQDLALSGTQVASLFLVAGVIQVVASPIAGKVSDHLGRKVLIVMACLCTCGIVGSVTMVATGMLTAMIFFGLAMTFESLRAAPLQALMSELVSSEQRGTFFSLCNAVGQCGFGFGSAMAGWLYVRAGYVSNSIAAAACMGLVALMVWAIIADPRRTARALAPATES